MSLPFMPTTVPSGSAPEWTRQMNSYEPGLLKVSVYSRGPGISEAMAPELTNAAPSKVEPPCLKSTIGLASSFGGPDGDPEGGSKKSGYFWGPRKEAVCGSTPPSCLKVIESPALMVRFSG